LITFLLKKNRTFLEQLYFILHPYNDHPARPLFIILLIVISVLSS
jgi:hypothetical protein